MTLRKKISRLPLEERNLQRQRIRSMEDKNSSKERIMVELTTENTRVKKIQSGVLITRTNKL